MYIAMRDETTGYSEPLLDHLNKVGDLSANFAKNFNLSAQAYVLGYLHDFGKYSKEFQKQIGSSHITIDYSIAGALELFHRFYSDKDLAPIAKLLGMVITGHYNGLLNLGVSQDLDNGTHESKFKKHSKDYYNGFSEIDENLIKIYREELNEKIQKSIGNKKDERELGFAWQAIIRMLFSCTLDADFIDTEIFLKKYEHHSFKSISYLDNDVEKFIKNNFYDNKKKTKKPVTNHKKQDILKQTLEASSKKPGFFTLIAPPNSLKTTSSFIFGIKHAIKNGLKRVIYVLPYNSIIDSDAKLFKNIVGEENVLEHLCDFTNCEKNQLATESMSKRYNCFTEDWNVPIVVTNAKEFFDTCFGSDMIKLRKLHNISNSVIIFDEIQNFPMGYMNPCFTFLNELMVNYNSSVVFCSSTGVEFNENLSDEVLKDKFDIIKNVEEIYDISDRVNFTYLGTLSDDEILKKLNQNSNSLCIVNTKVHAKRLYDKLKGEGVHYLSDFLTPYDRKNKMKIIENSLNNNEKCIVIATEEIETSFDLDFNFVYRSISSVDLIFKSSGKCNRRGLLDKGELFVFKPSSEDGFVKKDYEVLVKYCEDIIDEYGDKFLSLEAINDYFRLKYNFYFEKNKFDEKLIKDNFIIKRNQMKFNFKTCSDNFKLTDDDMYNIVIQNDFTKKIVDSIKIGYISKEDLRQLQQHCISICKNEYYVLKKANVLDVFNRFTILNDLNFYNNDIGLEISDESFDEYFYESI